MSSQKQKAPFKHGHIAYNDSGKGRVVILLHGFLGSSEIWGEVKEQLQKRFRVVSIDLPGHGQSDSFGYVHHMDLMAKAVKAVMDHLRLKKYVLIGHSMGGYTALAFAELFPEHVRGICLFHSTSYADSDAKKRERSKAVKIVKTNPILYIKATIQNLFATQYLKKHKREISFTYKIAKRTNKRGIINALEGMKERPSRDVVLHFADYPVLFIIGKYDNILPMQILIEQSTLAKQHHTLLLEKTGHMGFLEEPVLCAKYLKRFIRASFAPYKKTKIL